MLELIKSYSYLALIIVPLQYFLLITDYFPKLKKVFYSINLILSLWLIIIGQTNWFDGALDFEVIGNSPPKLVVKIIINFWPQLLFFYGIGSLIVLIRMFKTVFNVEKPKNLFSFVLSNLSDFFSLSADDYALLLVALFLTVLLPIGTVVLFLSGEINIIQFLCGCFCALFFWGAFSDK